MPRQPRLNIANGLYHVTQRGLEKRDIVLHEKDRQEWFRLLNRHATRCGWRVFAYALLSNHFHLFLRTPQPNLSAGMQAFESGYVSLFNREHKRDGPLFQSRFHAVLVEHESHARLLSRYVHLNPHRAGLDPQPGTYRWCSLRYYLDPRGAPPWLDWQTILSEISLREAAARVAYRRFIAEGASAPLANPLAQATDDGLLGSAAFIERYRVRSQNVRGQAPQNSKLAEQSVEGTQDFTPPILNFAVPDPCLQQLLHAVAAAFNVPISHLLAKGKHSNWPRDAAIWLAFEKLHQSHAVIAQAFGGVTTSSIRESLKRTQSRLQQPPSSEFQAILQQLQ